MTVTGHDIGDWETDELPTPGGVPWEVSVRTHRVAVVFPAAPGPEWADLSGRVNAAPFLDVPAGLLVCNRLAVSRAADAAGGWTLGGTANAMKTELRDAYGSFRNALPSFP